jgi:hypothetical protein
MKEILEKLYQHKTLSKLEAKQILIDITTGKYNEYQIASFLTAFLMRSITLEELKGFREGLLEQSISVEWLRFAALRIPHANNPTIAMNSLKKTSLSKTFQVFLQHNSSRNRIDISLI